MVVGVWFRLRDGVAVGWQVWASLVAVMVLFSWLWTGAVGGLSWMACVVFASMGEEPTGGAAEGWLVWVAVRRVAVRRCRMWCMMLIAG